MRHFSTMLLCDAYKLSHKALYPQGTTHVYSTWTARNSRDPNFKTVIAFGFQAFVQKYLINYFNEEFFGRDKKVVVAEYIHVVKNCLFVSNPETKHIEDLWDLGYLPLEIKAVAEGTKVPIKVPMMTIENTDPKFFWLTNYIETLASCELWKSSTSATIANEYRKILEAAAERTGGALSFVPFQGHDFSFRGLSSLDSAMSSGAGHLLSFVGTDTMPAITYLENYYYADASKELIGCSVPATEHSIQSSFGNDLKYFQNTINNVHPTGIVSIVSDGYDFWDVVGNILPALKSDIMKRDGKVVIRPDSGDPVKIICGDPDSDESYAKVGLIQCLWNTFGGTVNEKGFKVLDSHIGAIYGDSITLDRCRSIVDQLEKAGFASTNVVFGIGSYTYQYNTRDTFGFALKSTLVKINGEEKQIFKAPKTDSGVKTSQKGAVVVYDVNGTLAYEDGLMLQDARNTSKINLLQTIFKNGQIYNVQTLKQIRAKVRS
jgi:nicotinamide phosphoribosyltransferase